MRTATVSVGFGLAAASTALSGVAASNPRCRTADAMLMGIQGYLRDWDNQLLTASDPTWKCQQFAEFIHASRDKIQAELSYTYGNMTTKPSSLLNLEGANAQNADGQQDEAVSKQIEQAD